MSCEEEDQQAQDVRKLMSEAGGSSSDSSGSDRKRNRKQKKKEKKRAKKEKKNKVKCCSYCHETSDKPNPLSSDKVKDEAAASATWPWFRTNEDGSPQARGCLFCTVLHRVHPIVRKKKRSEACSVIHSSAASLAAWIHDRDRVMARYNAGMTAAGLTGLKSCVVAGRKHTSTVKIQKKFWKVNAYRKEFGSPSKVGLKVITRKMKNGKEVEGVLVGENSPDVMDWESADEDYADNQTVHDDGGMTVFEGQQARIANDLIESMGAASSGPGLTEAEIRRRVGALKKSPGKRKRNDKDSYNSSQSQSSHDDHSEDAEAPHILAANRFSTKSMPSASSGSSTRAVSASLEPHAKPPPVPTIPTRVQSPSKARPGCPRAPPKVQGAEPEAKRPNAYISPLEHQQQHEAMLAEFKSSESLDYFQVKYSAESLGKIMKTLAQKKGRVTGKNALTPEVIELIGNLMDDVKLLQTLIAAFKGSKSQKVEFLVKATEFNQKHSAGLPIYMISRILTDKCENSLPHALDEAGGCVSPESIATWTSNPESTRVLPLQVIENVLQSQLHKKTGSIDEAVVVSLLEKFRGHLDGIASADMLGDMLVALRPLTFSNDSIARAFSNLNAGLDKKVKSHPVLTAFVTSKLGAAKIAALKPYIDRALTSTKTTSALEELNAHCTLVNKQDPLSVEAVASWASSLPAACAGAGVEHAALVSGLSEKLLDFIRKTDYLVEAVFFTASNLVVVNGSVSDADVGKAVMDIQRYAKPIGTVITATKHLSTISSEWPSDNVHRHAIQQHVSDTLHMKLHWQSLVIPCLAQGLTSGFFSTPVPADSPIASVMHFLEHFAELQKHEKYNAEDPAPERIMSGRHDSLWCWVQTLRGAAQALHEIGFRHFSTLLREALPGLTVHVHVADLPVSDAKIVPKDIKVCKVIAERKPLKMDAVKSCGNALTEAQKPVVMFVQILEFLDALFIAASQCQVAWSGLAGDSDAVKMMPTLSEDNIQHLMNLLPGSVIRAIKHMQARLKAVKDSVPVDRHELLEKSLAEDNIMNRVSHAEVMLLEIAEKVSKLLIDMHSTAKNMFEGICPKWKDVFLTTSDPRSAEVNKMLLKNPSRALLNPFVALSKAMDKECESFKTIGTLATETQLEEVTKVSKEQKVFVAECQMTLVAGLVANTGRKCAKIKDKKESKKLVAECRATIKAAKVKPLDELEEKLERFAQMEKQGEDLE